MKKENEVWTLISPACHTALFQIAEQRKIPATKLILNIIYNKLPERLEDDYTFSSNGARKIVLKLSDKEFEYITDLSSVENVKTSRFLRMVVYTFLKNNNLIE